MKQKMSTENLEEIDIFSSTPTERKIEEDFLRRMLESMRQNSQALLDGQGDSMESAVGQQLRLFGSPAFRKLSEYFEKSVPEEAGFQKFPFK